MTSTDEEPGLQRRRVRPYAITGGRTRPTHHDLEIEALVSTTSVGERTPKLTVEQRAIGVLCHHLLSIAEVSARLHLPLGVTRVLVGDMADEHLVICLPARPRRRPSRPGPAGTGPVRPADPLRAPAKPSLVGSAAGTDGAGEWTWVAGGQAEDGGADAGRG